MYKTLVDFAFLLIDEKRLDILINNAAIMVGKHRKITEDGIEEQLQVNCMGKNGRRQKTLMNE